MTDEPFHLDRAPIVEAVLDIDCDQPAGFSLEGLEEDGARRFALEYPKRAHQWIDEVQFEHGPEGTVQKHRRQINAIRFISEDEKQLVQLRLHGFSFNRLAPYDNLDSYLPSIQSAWEKFVEIVEPVAIRTIKLRYINRIEIPEMPMELGDYFKIAASNLWGDDITIGRFLTQYIGIHKETGSELRVTLSDVPESGHLAVAILDIEVASNVHTEPGDWATVSSVVSTLRKLKNKLFKESLTPKCLQLFQD